MTDFEESLVHVHLDIPEDMLHEIDSTEELNRAAAAQKEQGDEIIPGTLQ